MIKDVVIHKLRLRENAHYALDGLSATLARLLGNYRQDLGDGGASDRDSYAPAPESRGLGMHLDRHGKLDGIQPSRRHRSSQPHSRNPKCFVARAPNVWVRAFRSS